VRILLLAHYYPPEIGGAAARLHGLSRWLKKLGHDVTVIAGFPNYPSGVIPRDYDWKFSTRETMDEVDVIRTRVFASTRGGTVRRLANYLSFTVMSCIAGLLCRKRFDVVVASCPPLFIGLSGWVIARLRRARFVFDIRDLWPDVAVEAGEFSADGRVTKVAEALARFIYRRSDHIIPVTENKKKRLLEKGVPAEKISVVFNGVDLDLVPPLDDCPTLREELSLGDSFVAVYAGLLGIAQRVEVLVEAANELRDCPNIHILIVGDGVRRKTIEAKILELHLDNVTMLPRQPREQMPKVLATADVCLVPLATSNLTDAVPSKLLEAWAYRRPAILVAAGESAELVEQSQGGLVVPPGEYRQVADALRKLEQDRGLAEQYGQNGYEFVRRHLDRPQLAQQMSDILERLCGIQSNGSGMSPKEVDEATLHATKHSL